MQIQYALTVGGLSLYGLVLPVLGGPTALRDGASWGIPTSHVIHERHEPIHLEGWATREPADAEWMLPVRVGLKQSNMDKGHELLMDISNPRSPNYGKHLTRSEVIELFAPSNRSVEKVKRWLISGGIDGRRLSLSANKQWIQFDAPVREVEELLLTKYHIFEHAETGARSIACSQYHVPHDVTHHVDYITPGIKLMSGSYDEKITKPMPGRRAMTEDLPGQWKNGGKWIANGNSKGKGKCKPGKPPVDPGEDDSRFRVTGPCSDEITPQCIRAQYHIPNGTKATQGNELGIFQGLNQHYSPEDLDTYWKYIAPWVPQGTHPKLKSINGALGPTNNRSLAGDEADLDFEVAIPLIWPQKSILFQTDDEWYQKNQLQPDTKYPGFFNTFYDALDASYCTLAAFNHTGNCRTPACRDPEYPNPNAPPSQGGYHGPLMCGRHRPTHVLSISYSGTEASWPAGYMRRQCLEVMKLALQGVTVVESSGDYGVGGARFDSRAGCLGKDRDVYAPRVMANCPYVLSVGATALVEPEVGDGKTLVEVAAEAFASGGGFSNVFARPEWQDGHVQGYLERANVSHLGYEDTDWLLGPGLDGVGDAGAATSSPEKGKLFNKAGRGYPDVSAIGENFRVVLRGHPNRMHGTSVAAPIWASILTLINEERLAAGKSTVGFVHQVLYEHPEVFTDIQIGSNPGCGGDGFQVKEGWDPVTGLGTPIYPRLLELFMSLP
ncbi:peptidase S8/S53 domain-containing protein [Achaetomium macrosporum]|uniref:Peptidase S8/S53 domain-containing protein n=1 Tax=Achaetomium macrosporum TaxID=79813 RepID=A0AAN7C3W8_9PEZI|nr:peptidase S8/S53 domain-containing protein [Achaetomium macrosporum]